MGSGTPLELTVTNLSILNALGAATDIPAIIRAVALDFTEVTPNRPDSITVYPTAPASATAVAMNVTIVNPKASEFAAVWPYSKPRPLACNAEFYS